MTKPAFYICDDKDADQLSSNHGADQGLYFRYCCCTAWFVSDLIRNPDRFSHEWLI